jgi:hypothetical protein
MLRPRTVALALAAAGSIAASSASAQVTLGADLGIYSDYVWRGLTLTSKPVIQPDIWAGIPVASGLVTIGGWFNLEPGRYDGGNDISQGGGMAGPDLTEFDPWVDYTRTLNKLTLTLGGTGYVYPNHPPAGDSFARGSASNTIELYGKFGLDALLSPRLSAYYDIKKVKGLYVEGSVSHSLALSKSFALTLRALAGWNHGQGINTKDPAERANFEDDGITHLDFSASTSFDVGPISIAPVFHFMVLHDTITKFTQRNDTHDTSIWFGAALSWAAGGGGGSEKE